MPYQYLIPSSTAAAALSYGPTYSAASPECLTSNQFHLLQLLLLFLTALLTLLLHLDALPVPNSLFTAIAALSHDLLTLLLLTNSLTMTKLPLLRLLLLFLRPYLRTMLLLLNSLTVTKLLLLRPLLLFLRPYLLCCFL